VVGDRKCFSAEPDLYQECAADAAGCRVWGTPTKCDTDQVCKGAGVCETACSSDCTEAGKVECASGTQYKVCMTVQPGCLKWGEIVACPGTLTCQGGQCGVPCTPDADCEAAGEVGCSDGTHQKTCEEVLAGCVKWGAPVVCDLHQVCGATGCACENPCTDGAAECLPDGDPQFRKVCRADGGGCRYWAHEDCGGGATCDAGACVEICASDPACTAAGVTRCESLDSFATCAEVAGHPGCIQFGAATMCPVHQECGESTGACACRVEAGCNAAAVKRCIDYDNTATCKADDKGCLYWGAPEHCPSDNTCADGVCSPICTSDLDCTSAGIVQCTTDGKQQTCVQVEAGCIKWAPAQDCPAHQACAAGTGCVCSDSCNTGETRCVGLHQHQSCAAADGLGCTYWSAVETCDGSDSCVKGGCSHVVSPVVDCGSITFNLVLQRRPERDPLARPDGDPGDVLRMQPS